MQPVNHTPVHRAYNMIITERQFGPSKHAYALLGYEAASQSWNLLGGQQDPQDPTRGATAARELYEESAMMLDKRGDVNYWKKLPFYEYGSHKVFIHGGTLPVCIKILNTAAMHALNNSQLPRAYKEMTKYQLVKLTDLVAMATAGTHNIISHPMEGPMAINQWVLYTLKKSDTTALRPYLY